MEFKVLEDYMIDDDNSINMVYVPAQQHVPEVERAIRVIKERFRAAYHSLPYKMIPKLMVKALVGRLVKWLNMFPPQGGISAHYSPRAIVTGLPLDYNNHCKHSFGSYVQAGNENDPTNTPAPRTLDCIYLDSIDGDAGGFKCLHLATKKEVIRRDLTEIPIPQVVIKRVESLARRDGMPSKLEFLTRKKGKFVLDDDDDALLAGVDDNNNNDNDNEEELEVEPITVSNYDVIDEDDEEDDSDYEEEDEQDDDDDDTINSEEI